MVPKINPFLVPFVLPIFLWYFCPSNFVVLSGFKGQRDAAAEQSQVTTEQSDSWKAQRTNEQDVSRSGKMVTPFMCTQYEPRRTPV